MVFLACFGALSVCPTGIPAAFLCCLSLAGLKPGGIIFVKDNLPINPAKFQVNRDSGLNIFRTEPHYNWLYKSAGLKIIARQQQQEWIPDANPVLMWQLKPE